MTDPLTPIRATRRPAFGTSALVVGPAVGRNSHKKKVDGRTIQAGPERTCPSCGLPWKTNKAKGTLKNHGPRANPCKGSNKNPDAIPQTAEQAIRNAEERDSA